MEVKNFFKEQGPFMKYGTLLFNFMAMSMVWLVFSGVLPLFALIIILSSNFMAGPIGFVLIFICLIHVGPASAAGFYTMSRMQREKDTYFWREFWGSYKMNYRQGIILGGIFTALLMILAVSFYFELVNTSIFGKTIYFLLPMQIFMLFEVVFIMLYSYALLARFDMKVFQFIRLSYLMSNKHLPTTALCFVLFAAVIFIIVACMPIAVILLVGVFLYLEAALLERVFRKYMPDQDEELLEEEVEGFSLDAERQAIIDRYTGNVHRNTDEEATITIVQPEEKEEETAQITIVRAAEGKEE